MISFTMLEVKYILLLKKEMIFFENPDSFYDIILPPD